MFNDDAMRAMVRKYMFDDSSRRHLTEDERVNHIVQEMKYMVARSYGFNTVEHMHNALTPKHKVGDINYGSTVQFANDRRKA